MSSNSTSPPAAWTFLRPYVLGGMAGMVATTAIQPIDMVKVRIQLSGEGGKGGGSANPLAVGRKIVAEEGARALYKGLGAAYMRQLTYATTRLGIFQTVLDAIQARKPASKLTLADRTLAGVVAGGLGSLCGVPADLSLVRMQSDAVLPPELRRNYKGVFHAFSSIVKSEGVLGLWRGSGPTVVRAIALNVGQLAGNSEALARLQAALGTDTEAKRRTATFGAAFVAAFLASFFSLPFDFVKTRLQKQVADPATGKGKYAGVVDCFRQVMKEEGFVFYRGFGTYYTRVAPHVVITMLVLDWLNRFAAARGY
ncbi:mitochondrial substrate carrier [Hyaloraphidium curvatum]|nr:mitochondrial substrate carrier [Hyaloraphidium curvatum]